LLFKPAENSLIDLVADFTDKFKLFLITALKFCRVIEGPMLVLSHVEENGWAILLCISTHCDNMSKNCFAQIFANALGTLPNHIQPAFFHYCEHIRQNMTFRLQAGTVNFKMLTCVGP